MHIIWSFSLFFQKWNHTAHIILLLSFLTWNIMAISCGKRCRSNLLFWMHCAVFNHIQLFATPWTVVRQAPLSMEFSRQEYWSGLPWLPSGIFPTQGSNPGLPHWRQILYHLNHQGSPKSASNYGSFKRRIYSWGYFKLWKLHQLPPACLQWRFERSNIAYKYIHLWKGWKQDH